MKKFCRYRLSSIIFRRFVVPTQVGRATPYNHQPSTRSAINRTATLRISLLLLFCAFVPLCLLYICSSMAEEEMQNPPPKLEYIGSEKCKLCHSELFAKFSKTLHFNLIGDEELSKEYKGCEACHGPASEHINGGKKEYIINPKNHSIGKLNETCGKCHFREKNPPKENWKKSAKREVYWSRSLHSQNDVSCLSCHNLHSTVPKYLAQPSEKLCFTCHSNKQAKKGEFTHSPVAGGKCYICHDPHGSRFNHLVIENLTEGCLTCHKVNDKFKTEHGNMPVEKQKKYNCAYCHNPHSKDIENKLLKKFKHEAFASKNCNICHQAAGETPFALKKAPKELCSMCHKEVYNEFLAKANIHPPVKEGFCLECHNPHLSDYEKGLLIDTPKYLCYKCHFEVTNKLLEGESKHKPVNNGECLKCHTPHSSDYSKLLRKDVISLCYTCHEIKGTYIHPVGKEKVMEKTGQTFDIYCTTCHKPHSSEIMKLLKDEQGKLCTKCHK